MEDNASPAAGYFASVNHGKERKKNMKKRRIGTYKRLLALVLALTMCFSMLQIYAYANQEEGLPLEPESTAPAQPEPIDPPAPETFVGQEGQAGRDSWIDAGSAQDQAQDLLDQANTDAELETSTGEPGIGSVNVPNENGDYDHTETTTTTTDTWNGQAGSEETGKVEVEGSETTVKTESTVPAGQDNPPQVVGDKTVVDGEETISYEKTEETIGDESSEKLSPEELKEYIEGTDDKTVTVTAPTDGKESSGQAVIGKVDEEKLVADQKTEKETAAKNELADKDKEAVDKLTADGFQPVYKVDETGNQVVDEKGNPIVEKYVKTDSITGEGEEGQKTTQVVRESSVETKPVEGDENSFETITKIVTTTTESTTAYKAPDDQPLKDIPEEQLTTVVDGEGKEIGKSASSQDPDTLAITVTTVYPEVDEEGNAYYRAVYVTTSADGLTVTTRTEIVKGETATVETTKTVTETKTETTAVQVPAGESGDRVVTVTMTPVEEDEGHGQWSNEGYQPDMENLFPADKLTVKGDPSKGYTFDDKIPATTVSKNESHDLLPYGSPDSYPLDLLKKWFPNDKTIQSKEFEVWHKKNYKEDLKGGFTSGNGLTSAITVGNFTYQKVDGEWVAKQDGQSDPTQKVVIDKDGNKHYVYCIDHGTPYNTDNPFDLENVEDVKYLGSQEEKDRISAIATLGYWGTKSGDGSLDAFKGLMSSIANSAQITDGIALTATQAALWYYGSSTAGSAYYNWDKVDIGTVLDDIFSVGSNNGNSYTRNLTETEKGLLKDIVKYMVKGNFLEDNKNTLEDRKSTDLVKASDVKGVSTTITTVVDNNGNYVHTADLTLTLQNSKLNPTGAFKATIIGADNEKQEITIDINQCIQEDGKGNYLITIPGVKVGNGKYTIKLDGAQAFTNGAYVFSDPDGYSEGQTMVGIMAAGGASQIALKFGLTFDIQEPIVEILQRVQEIATTESTTTRQWHAERENSYAEVNYPRDVPTPTPTPSEAPTPTPSEEPTPTPSEEPTPQPTDEPIDDPDVPLGTPEPDEPIDDPDVPLGTPEPDEPIDEPDVPLGTPTPQPNEPDEELPDPDVPKAPAEPEEELPDPEVPLANVPKTGDSPVLWYVLTLVSGCGLLVLALSGKRRKAAKR